MEAPALHTLRLIAKSAPQRELENQAKFVFFVRIDDIILILQQNRLQWYGHVLQKEDNDWVKKCTEYEVETQDQEVDQRGHGDRL